MCMGLKPNGSDFPPYKAPPVIAFPSNYTIYLEVSLVMFIITHDDLTEMLYVLFYYSPVKDRMYYRITHGRQLDLSKHSFVILRQNDNMTKIIKVTQCDKLPKTTCLVQKFFISCRSSVELDTYVHHQEIVCSM